MQAEPCPTPAEEAAEPALPAPSPVASDPVLPALEPPSPPEPPPLADQLAANLAELRARLVIGRRERQSLQNRLGELNRVLEQLDGAIMALEELSAPAGRR